VRPPLPPDHELAWSYFRASGPGGQHRNKKATAVRLVHLPTGITVVASERRSREQNRRVALERLARRLAQAAQKPRPRRPTRPSRAARRRRLQAKRHRSRLKRLRRPPGYED
jgi:protein subunit release factor B